MTDPSWLPDLILLSDFQGNAIAYLEAVYQQFEQDFIKSRPKLNGLPVQVYINPKEDNKASSYWHITHEGEVESERIFAARRCERIAWVRAIIENVTDPKKPENNYMKGTFTVFK